MKRDGMLGVVSEREVRVCCNEAQRVVVVEGRGAWHPSAECPGAQRDA